MAEGKIIYGHNKIVNKNKYYISIKPGKNNYHRLHFQINDIRNVPTKSADFYFLVLYYV